MKSAGFGVDYFAKTNVKDQNDNSKSNNNDDNDNIKLNKKRGSGNEPNSTGNIIIFKNNTDSLMDRNMNSLGFNDNKMDLNNKDIKSKFNINNRNSSEDDNNSNKALRNINNNNNLDINKINNKGYNTQDLNDLKINNQFSEEDEGNVAKVLADGKNNEILSEDRKPFVAEELSDEIKEKKVQGNKVLAITKGGESFTLNVLRNYEGEILTDENGNIILGRGNIYFIDKNGDLIVIEDKKLLEGDTSCPVKIKKVKFNPFSSMFSTFNSNFNSDKNIPQLNQYGGNYNSEGLRNTFYNSGKSNNMGASQYKRRNLSKTRFKVFPKGDGDAKPPIIKKRKRKIKK